MPTCPQAHGLRPFQTLMTATASNPPLTRFFFNQWNDQNIGSYLGLLDRDTSLRLPDLNTFGGWLLHQTWKRSALPLLHVALRQFVRWTHSVTLAEQCLGFEIRWISTQQIVQTPYSSYCLRSHWRFHDNWHHYSFTWTDAKHIEPQF